MEISRGALSRLLTLRGGSEAGDVAGDLIASRSRDEEERGQTGTTAQMGCDAFTHEAVSEASGGIVEVPQLATFTPLPSHAAPALSATPSPSPSADGIEPSLPAGGGELDEQIVFDLLRGTLKAAVGFVLGAFTGWYGVRYNHINKVDIAHEEEQFVNALLSTHLPYL